MMKKIVILFFIHALLTGAVTGNARTFKRVISLGPTVTENIYLLGAQDRLIADTVYCTRPPAAADKPDIGTVINFDMEKIVSLDPDLVIATELTDEKTVRKLKKIGIEVYFYRNPDSFTQFKEGFLSLARILGEEEKGEKIIGNALMKIDEIKKRNKYEKVKKVFVQVGASPLFTINSKTLLNDLIEFAGGINIAGNSSNGLYSIEKVIEVDPDFIIIVTMGITGEKEKRKWMEYQTLSAVKNNRIFIVDSYRYCSPTPESFVAGLEEMETLLHGRGNGR